MPAGSMLQSQGPLHGLGCDCLDICPNLQLAATGGADKLVKLHPLLVGTAASLEGAVWHDAACHQLLFAL